MDWKNRIISIVVSLIVTAIVIHNTHGRISRNRYWKIEIIMLAGFICYWAFAVAMLFVFRLPLFYGIGIIGNLIFIYKYWQLQILRFHDLNYSGWYCLSSYIPIVGLYFLYVRFAKKRISLLNEFDESIDYLSFLRKNNLYPEISFISIDGMDFFVNGVKFEYRKYNNHVQYEVSKMSLEENKILEEYCKKNLKQTENAPSYAEKYKISFLDEGNFLENIKKDLHAIVDTDRFLLINGAEIFVRKNYGLYDIVYKKEFSLKVKLFSAVEDDGDYCCQSVTRQNLVQLMKCHLDTLPPKDTCDGEKMDSNIEEHDSTDYTNFEERFFSEVKNGRDYQHFLNLSSQMDCMFIRSLLASMDIPTYIEGENMNKIFGGTATTLTNVFKIKLYILTDDYDEASSVVIDYISNKVKSLSEKNGKDKYLKILELLAAPYNISPSQEILGITMLKKKTKKEKTENFLSILKRLIYKK